MPEPTLGSVPVIAPVEVFNVNPVPIPDKTEVVSEYTTVVPSGSEAVTVVLILSPWKPPAIVPAAVDQLGFWFILNALANSPVKPPVLAIFTLNGSLLASIFVGILAVILFFYFIARLLTEKSWNLWIHQIFILFVVKRKKREPVITYIATINIVLCIVF